jgi:eukaryotic-like serine/threonine-protein kinase
MKRCPECRKSYLDDSLLYCLDDGAMLVQGTVTDETATAILSSGPTSGSSQAWPVKVDSPFASALSGSAFRKSFPWLVAATFGCALLALSVWLLLKPELPKATFVQLDITAPAGWATNPTSSLSPDGSRLAFTATHPEQKTRLWVRDLATGESHLLNDTEDAVEPFWSPDGTEVAYFTRDRLRSVNLGTGKSRVICDVIGARRAGSWNSSGVIIFATEAGTPISRVNADGKSSPVKLSHGGFRPFFLPDGRHFLFGDRGQSTSFSAGIFVGDLETGEVKEILADGAEPKYSGGYLFVVRDGQLQAQRFDVSSFKVAGEPVIIGTVGQQYSGLLGTNYSVAANGLVAFRRTVEVPREIALYTREGVRTVLGEPDYWTNPVLSADDSLVALERGRLADGDIWLLDQARGTLRMFASGKPGGAVSPIWSADGTSLFYRKRLIGFIEKALAGGTERVVLTNEPGPDDNLSVPTHSQLTADGRFVGFQLRNGNRDIVIQSPSGEETVFAQSPANETQPALSPDEKWLAYVYRTEESLDTRGVFVEAFPGGGQKMSASGDVPASQPRWRKDGRELYFVGSDGNLMAVPVEVSGGALKLGIPKVLFKTAIPAASGLGTRANYDAYRDGSRFIVTEPKAMEANWNQPVTVLVNWMSALR